MLRISLATALCVVYVTCGDPRALAVAFQAPKDEILAESWDAIYVGDSKVGQMHVWIEPVKDGKGRDLRRVRVRYEMTFARGSDKSKTELEYGTIETPEGEVLRLDTLTRASKQDIRTYGDVADGKMVLNFEVGKQKTQQVIPWGADVRGPYAAELSLSRMPLKPGEARSVKTFIPDVNKVCLTNLKAVDFEEIPLGPEGKKHKLMRIEQSVTGENGEAMPMPPTTIWVDETGQIMKSFTNAFGGMYTYRTTKAGATAPSRGSFQLLGASIIKPSRTLTSPETARTIVYRLKGKDLAGLFPADQRQRVTAEQAGEVTLEVHADTPATGESGGEQVDAAFSRANPLVDSEDSNVVRHSRTAVGNLQDPWQKAVAIEEWVFNNMKQKNFQINFAPAAQVARELSGDCTEHAVLTAAMCRAAGIPTRCVVGLVYAASQGGYGFHMWNEVYVNRRWVAIDSAYHQSQVDPTHIKMLDTSLDGVAPFETFLPVLQVFGNLSIEPIEIRR
jgi:hypothetical protein